MSGNGMALNIAKNKERRIDIPISLINLRLQKLRKESQLEETGAGADNFILTIKIQSIDS